MTEEHGITYVGMREEGDTDLWLLSWGGKGFGEICIKFKKDGTIELDDEFMGKDFVKAALCAVVDKAVLKYEDGLEGNCS